MFLMDFGCYKKIGAKKEQAQPVRRRAPAKSWARAVRANWTCQLFGLFSVCLCCPCQVTREFCDSVLVHVSEVPSSFTLHADDFAVHQRDEELAICRSHAVENWIRIELVLRNVRTVDG